MAAVIVAETQIDGSRAAKRHPFPADIIDCLHQLQSSGKTGSVRGTQLDNDDITVRRCAGIVTVRGTSVSGGNP